MTDDSSPKWPNGVEEIRIGDLKRLGIDGKRGLFWDGQRIEVNQRLNLTGLQNFVAAMVALFAIFGGLGACLSGPNDGAAFLRARNTHWLSCPAPQPLPNP